MLIMNANKQYIPVVLFFALHKVVITLRVVKSWNVIIQTIQERELAVHNKKL